MAIVTGDRYLDSLVKFVEYQAERLIEGTLVLRLNPVGLRYVQSRLEAFAELESLLAGAPVDYLRAYVTDLGDHRALEQLRRILRLLPSLKLVSVLPTPGRDPTPLYLLPFGRLKVLEIRGCDLSTSAAKGLLELRFTLEKLICHNSTDALRHVFASRIADIRDSPKWNRLCFVSCSCNSLVLMDESLQLLPVIETLDLSRNKFAAVDNLRKVTKLKHVDLGFNNLRSIVAFSEVSCQIVKLVLRNNALTSLHGIENLKSLQGLDISYNIISDFSNIEFLAGFSSLEDLWLEGNPICYARWFRPQVFSLFPHPYQLKLDEKKISTTELWKRQIIMASRQEQPASFGFYSPVHDQSNIKGSVDAKRAANHKKRISRLVNIEDDCDACIFSDQESVSCDNQSPSKEENTDIDQEAEADELMTKVELLKKGHSVLWLQELKEWMNPTSNNSSAGNDFKNTSSHKNKGFYLNSKSMYEDLDETSRHISDSFHLSGDESSTMVLGSETSFADTSTVVSVQRYSAGDKFLFKNFKFNQEDTSFFNNEGNAFVDAGGSVFNSRVVPGGETMTTGDVTPAPLAVNDITGPYSPSVCPGSPPHYKDDILLRRHNLEEEILQLSAESLSVASSDSNTSCDDNYSDIDTSIAHDCHDILENSFQWARSCSFLDPNHGAVGDDYDEKISALKSNGTHVSSLCFEGNFVKTDDAELDISVSVCSGSSSNALHDDEDLGFVKRKTDGLEITKYKRKPRRRLISLPEEVDLPDDMESPKTSSDNVEICRSDMSQELKGQEMCFSGDQLKYYLARHNEDKHIPVASNDKVGFIESYFNSTMSSSGVNEICRKHVQCSCLFAKKSGCNEREVTVLLSSEQKLYIFVGACDGSGAGLEMVGCYGIAEVTEVYVGLGLQTIRLCFEGETSYLFITRCTERSRELLCLLNISDSPGMKNTCSLTSLEQIQFNLFVEYVCGSSNTNIFQYAMVLFCPKHFGDNLWLPRSLFVLEGCLLLSSENLSQFGPYENAFSPNYFLLDSCCAIVDVLKMEIETMDGLFVTLTLECTSELRPDKGCRIEYAYRKKKSNSDPLIWKLKWFSRNGLFNFVTLVKAMHSEASSTPLVITHIT